MTVFVHRLRGPRADTLLAPFAFAWERFAEYVAKRRRLAAERRAFDRLDAAALRDLGLSRGEYDSYCLEAEGLVERTRRRVAAFH